MSSPSFAKHLGFLLAISLSLLPATASAVAGGMPIPKWDRISTTTGELPLAEVGDQVSTVVFDVDRDGIHDFVIGGWGKPSAVWYRRNGSKWDRYLIEPGVEYIEAGGDFFDIDGDGDLDLAEGGDYRTLNEVWWWENPYPNFDPKVPWTRRLVKNSDEGGKSHHDQIFGDFSGKGKAQLVFWNQHAGKLFLAQAPSDPRNAGSWPLRVIYSFAVPAEGKFEGLAKGDLDRDGRLDIVGAGRWFQNIDGERFHAHDVDAGYFMSRSAVGDLVKGGKLEVALSSGDGIGPLNWYEAKDGRWLKHTLVAKAMFGHTLQVADINGDGNEDIFAAEMDAAEMGVAGHECEMWIFYGDGKGSFVKTVLRKGVGSHESKLGDVDGDGDVDIIQKAFRRPAGRIDIWLNRG